LVVLTRPKSYEPARPKGIFYRYFIEPVMQKHSKNFYKIYINRDKIHQEELSIIMGNKKYKKKKVNIVVIFPEESLKVGRTTKSRRVLKNAAIQGAAKTLQLFDVNPHHHKELFKFFNYEKILPQSQR